MVGNVVPMLGGTGYNSTNWQSGPEYPTTMDHIYRKGPIPGVPPILVNYFTFNSSEIPMQLEQFKQQLETYIKNVQGDNNTVVSIKAGDLRTLISLAESQLRILAKSQTPGTVVSVMEKGPIEPNSKDHKYVNEIL